MPTIVDIFIFISRENFMLSLAWKKFYNLGPVFNNSMRVYLSFPYSHVNSTSWVCYRYGLILLHYENTPIQIYRKFHLQNLNIFRWKTLIFFHTFAQNIDCVNSLEPPRRGGSNEYPQSMFLSKKKNHVYPCKPQFYYIKVGFKGVKII